MPGADAQPVADRTPGGRGRRWRRCRRRRSSPTRRRTSRAGRATWRCTTRPARPEPSAARTAPNAVSEPPTYTRWLEAGQVDGRPRPAGRRRHAPGRPVCTGSARRRTTNADRRPGVSTRERDRPVRVEACRGDCRRRGGRPSAAAAPRRRGGRRAWSPRPRSSRRPRRPSATRVGTICTSQRVLWTWWSVCQRNLAVLRQRRGHGGRGTGRVGGRPRDRRASRCGPRTWRTTG